MSTQPLPDPDWKALSALLPGRIEPLSPERIYDDPKTSVYRLPGAGRGGSIAKLCRLEVASVERTVYEEVLPRLPLTRPAYYGSAPAGEVAGPNRRINLAKVVRISHVLVGVKALDQSIVRAPSHPFRFRRQVPVVRIEVADQTGLNLCLTGMPTVVNRQKLRL
jgi:hypothetical protein